MTDKKQEDLLRKVRGLIAKANSTEHEGEREVFMRKADELMEKYAIDRALLMMNNQEGRARIIVRRDIDISWWSELREGVDVDARNYIAAMWDTCVTHCRCYSTYSVWDYRKKTAAVYGQDADLSYLDMLFTDLLLQMVDTIKPKFDPNKSLGENVYKAKMAGMKYTDIAVWCGHPEWREPNGTGGWKSTSNNKMLSSYKKYMVSIGKSPSDVIKIHPKTWQVNYVMGFVSMIQKRLRDMRQLREGGIDGDGSTALVLRDLRDLAREALWGDFPELRPHPADCTCKQCTAKLKPVKYRQGVQWDANAQGAGSTRGAEARIVTNDPKLRTPGKLNQ